MPGKGLPAIMGCVANGLSLVALLSGVISGPAMAAVDASAAVADYALSVSVDPQSATLSGQARIRVPQPATLTVGTGTLRVMSLTVDGQRKPIPKSDTLRLRVRKTLTIDYRGAVETTDDNRIDATDIVLTDGWYPAIEGAVRYRLDARLPKDYLAISEAETSDRREEGATTLHRFDYPHPLTDGLTLVASRDYRVAQARHGDVLLETWLKPEFESSAQVYLARMTALLDDYQVKFGPYPHRRLAVVQAPVASSLSLPGFVLLHADALRETPELPTLAHELVHEWFGNSAYIAFDTGNWAEGAAIYFADHALDELKGNGWRCRKRMLTGYHNWVKDRAEIPLTQFWEREDRLTRWIGYGKGALVFHMLRQEIGDAAFFTAIRDFLARHRYRLATWDDLRASAERAGGHNLGWFFRQWVADTGAPNLSATVATQRKPQGAHATKVTFRQTGQVFRMHLPLRLTTPSETRRERVWLDAAEQSFRFDTMEAPTEIVIDENYDVLRALDDSERYPTVEQVEAATGVTLIMPPGDAAPYAPLLDQMRKEGKIAQFRSIRPEFPRAPMRGNSSPDRERRASRSPKTRTGFGGGAGIAASFIVLGADNPALNRLLAAGARPATIGRGAAIEVFLATGTPNRLIAVIDSRDSRDSATLLQHLPMLSGYSRVRVENGEVRDKSVTPHARGWSLPIPFHGGADLGTPASIRR